VLVDFLAGCLASSNAQSRFVMAIGVISRSTIKTTPTSLRDPGQGGVDWNRDDPSARIGS
jgi:hypothetical protein